jgi:succinate dehydrogenase / fumarate reductase flavoprotein subunit
MTYTPEMLEMIKVVEASRQRRLKETFPSMSMEERERVLEDIALKLDEFLN